MTVGSVDPVKAVVGNPHVQVAGDGEKRDRGQLRVNAGDYDDIDTPYLLSGGLVRAQ